MQKLPAKQTQPLPGHLLETIELPIIGLLQRCILLSLNGTQRHVFFINTELDCKSFLCFVSKPNSLPVSVDVESPFFFKGLHILPEFISEKVESELLQVFDQFEFEKLSNRKVQHFGYKFIYGANSVSKGNKGQGYPAPGIFHSVLLRDNNYYQKSDLYMDTIRPFFLHKLDVKDEPKTEESVFNQFTVNCYSPGNGIPPHVDSHAPFEEPVVSLSLLSSVVITFRSLEDASEQHVVLPSRCLMVMTGEARYNWTHCIANRKMDRLETKGVVFRDLRYSLTYRAVKDVAFCDCDFPKGCDDKENVLRHEKLMK